MKTFALATIAALAEANSAWRFNNSATTGTNKITSYYSTSGSTSAKDINWTGEFDATSTVAWKAGASETMEMAGCMASSTSGKSDCISCIQTKIEAASGTNKVTCMYNKEVPSAFGSVSFA